MTMNIRNKYMHPPTVFDFTIIKKYSLHIQHVLEDFKYINILNI